MDFGPFLIGNIVKWYNKINIDDFGGKLMELKPLEYFVAIAEYKNLTKASEALFVSQPYLSAVLSRLEAEFGYKLFLREKKGLLLTKEGEALLYHANRVLSEMASLESRMHHFDKPVPRNIRLSSENSIFIGNWLKTFIEGHRDIAIYHSLATAEKQEALLSQGKLDFAITTSAFPSADYEQVFLKRDKYVLLVPRSHFLAEKKAIFLRAAKEALFLALPKSEHYTRLIDKIAPLAGFEPKIVFEGETHLLEQFCAYTKACLVHLKSEGNTAKRLGLVEVELKDAFCEVDIYLSWYKDRALSRSGEALLRFLQERTS